MKKTYLIMVLFFLIGCTTKVSIPLDSQPISEKKGTVIIFHEQGYTDEFHIFIDHEPVGKVTSIKPLKIAVEPGKHEIYTKVPMGVIDRVTTITLEEGQVQYMRIWLDIGMWVSSIRVDPTHKREFYKTRVTSDRLKELKETNTGYESD